MKQARTTGLLGTLLVLILAACGQPASPSTQAPDGFINLSVAFDSGTAPVDELRPMGLPFDPSDGSIQVDEVVVSVSDRDGKPVSFEESGNVYTAQSGGSTPVITLTPGVTGSGEAEVVLPAAGNPYTFESKGLYDTVPIGYQKLLQHVSVNSTVMIQLESILGAATLTPRYPTNYATPGVDIDLMLTVTANGHAELQVPISDFTAAYDAITGGTIVTDSNRGVRITAEAACTSVAVGGTVSGLLEDSGTFAQGELDINGTSGYSIDCVPASDGDLFFDHEPPTVSITGFNPATGRLDGEANDNVAITKVQVYDGADVVASTDANDINDGAAQIYFPAGGTAFHAILALGTGGTGSLQAFALDSSGNEGRSLESQNPLFIYVDANASSSGNGTAASPFDTVAKGLAAVAEGGTVYIRNGEYSNRGLIIQKDNITIRGESEQDTILKADGATHSVPGYGIEVRGDNVTLENFTLKGPGTGSNQGRGIHAAGNPVSTSILQGLLIRNVTVTGARQMGIAINTTSGTALENVTVTGSEEGEGLGINIKASENVSLVNVVTRDNLIGINIETASPTNNYALLDVHNVTIIGGQHNDTYAGVITERHPDREITGLSLGTTPGLHLAVRNPTQLKAYDSDCNGAPGTQYTYYVEDIDAAIELSNEFCDPTATTVQEISATDGATLFEFVVPEGLSIQTAVDAANPGATVNILAGTHNLSSRIVLDKAITLRGAGPTSILEVDDSRGITVNGGMDSVVDSLRLELGASANYAIELTGPSAHNVHLSNLEIEGRENALTGGTGVKIASGTNASGFSMTNVEIANVQYGVYVEGQSNTVFSNVLFEDVEIVGAADKGIYAEAMSNAVLSNLNISNAGNIGNSGGRNGAGISLNITSGPARNILITNSTVENSGASPNGGGAAITLKSQSGVVFNDIKIIDSTVSNTSTSGSGVGLQIGEPAPLSNDPGPSGVVINSSTIEGSTTGILNSTADPHTIIP